MTILLVDDQPSIISALMSGIDWHSLGFTSILTATSAAKARHLLQSHSIDIVVSDIEMPGEDGLSLLSWARSQGMTFEAILLTAHADFFYAKQAIALKVFDYVVQPARFEDIIISVKKAMAKIKEEHRQKSTSELQRINAAANSIVVQTLLEDWPDFEQAMIYPAEIEKRLTQMQQFGFSCTNETLCSVISVLSRSDDPSFLSATAACFEEIGHTLSVSGLFCSPDALHYTAVLFPSDQDSVPRILSALTAGLSNRYSRKSTLCVCTTELRFLKNALKLIDQYEKETSHKEAIHTIHIDVDAMLDSVLGQNRYLHYMTQIHQYILDHISEPLSRQIIAEDLHLSMDHVSFIIKSIENKSVKELITSVKMEHARQLLRNTQKPIGEISQKCGYDSFAYFSKVYKETYGLTPSQERQG